jgi:hypothetical protein
MISFLMVVFGFLGSVDNNGSSSYDICDNFKISADITDTSNGRNNGKIEVKVEGGKAPYKYSYFGPDRVKELETNNPKIQNLKKGKYIVIVADSENCNKHLEIFIK